MATYIPNVTDVFPEIQPFKPDYSFLQSALATKQAQYNSAFDQINSVYSSLLNADLTRPIDQERRAAFFKAADDNIKKITSLDLSLPQNVQTASNVFKPFYEDKNLVYDMMWTKKLNNAISTGQMYQNCLSDDCAGKYSPKSMEALGYKKLEFSRANDEEARGMGAPSYVPYVNIMSLAKELIGKDHPDIEITEKQGGYLVTTKNGPKAYNTILSYLSSTLAEDPRVQQYAETVAYANNMASVVQIADTKYNGNIKQAKAEHFGGIAQQLVQNDVERLDTVNKELSSVTSKLNMYDARLENNGQLSAKETADYKSLSAQQNLYTKTSANLEDRIRIFNESLKNGDYNMLEKAALRSSSNSWISEKIGEAANTEAYWDYSVEMKEDPYAYKQFSEALDWQYYQKKKALDYEYDKRLKEETEGDYDTFVPIPTAGEAGAMDMEKIASTDRTILNQSLHGYRGSLLSLVNSMENLGNSNASISSAVTNALKAAGVTKEQLQSGKGIGSIAMRRLQSELTSTIQKYPELTKALSSQLKSVSDSNQLLLATDASVAKNNKAVALNMLQSTEYDAEDKSVLRNMFAPDGQLYDANKAYAVARQQGVRMDKDDFLDLYDDLKDEFSEKYSEYAVNNQSYVSVGIPGIGGGGGVTTSYVVNGIADPERYKSTQTLALYDILRYVNSGKVAIGGSADVRSESDDDFNDIEENPYVKSYVANLRATMRMTKDPVSYSYSTMGLGSPEYSALNIKFSPGDKTLKAMLDAEQISKQEYAKLLANGVTMILPKAAGSTYLGEKSSVSNREIVLNTTGSYHYYNPGVGADITFKQSDDGSIIPSGTLYNTRTKTTEFVPAISMDITQFNSTLFALDNLNN